jgi:hypothetical protein
MENPGRKKSAQAAEILRNSGTIHQKGALRKSVKIRANSCQNPPEKPMNRAKSSLIGVNGEPGKPRLRRLSKRVKPRQTTFPDTGASSQISETSSWPSLLLPLAIFPLVAPTRRADLPRWSVAKAGAMRRRKRSDGGPKSEQVRAGQTFENFSTKVGVGRSK